MCRFCGLNCAGQTLLRVFPYSRTEVEEHPERERARDAVHDARGDRVVVAEPQRHPAARAPAPCGVEDPDDRAEDRREDQIRREADPLEARARHDRGGRPGEQQERQEEDQVDVVGQVRAEGVAPRNAARAGGRGEVAGVRADRQAGLVAVVDPPAEVVEGRRDDGDGQDVLHRRGEHVLTAHHAGLVGHEAHVDQPHEDDGEEVELLREDRAVERLARRARGVLELLDLRDDQSDHASSMAKRPLTRQFRNRAFGATVSPPERIPATYAGHIVRPNECHDGTYGDVRGRG